MNQHLNKRTIVAGAGGGGITSALLAALRGEKVTLIEAHSAIGGCASWFKRGQFVFDAGATTLSGVAEHEPLDELFRLLGHSPKLIKSDPGIVFHLSNGKFVRYHCDFELWMAELSRHFPGLNHRPFWELVRKINKKSWSLLKDIKTFPFRKFSDVKDVLKHPAYASLLPHLFISTDQALKKYGLDHPSYLELVNGILIISAQASSQNIPFLVGAMALSYPSETYAPVGGMKGLMDFFSEELHRLNVDVRLKTRVEKFSSGNVLLRNGEKLSADNIILNLPIWNLSEMAEGSVKNELLLDAKKHPGSWGAFTLYFGCKSEIRELYQQVHINHPDVKNYFVSFSIPGDLSRAPEGYQSVSISTHVHAEESIDKNHYTDIIMKDFLKRFQVSDLKFMTSGNPKTFERYTGRKSGFVGGLPFIFGKNPLAMISPITSDPTIFRIGDTVFPGQGLCGVTAGALQLHHRLS